MNALLPRFLKSAYRKEPISSFIVIVGAVDAVIGGVGEHWSLLSVGLLLIVSAGFLRWWQIQKAQANLATQKAKYFLPPSSSRPPLPMLTSKKVSR